MGSTADEIKQDADVVAKFDPMAICHALEKCLANGPELSMDSYLVAYRELNK